MQSQITENMQMQEATSDLRDQRKLHKGGRMFPWPQGMEALPFCRCDKIPEAISLERGKVCFDSLSLRSLHA